MNDPINERGFILDPRLSEKAFWLCDFPLSSVLLKDNAHYPWFMLVPRRPELSELCALSAFDAATLFHELKLISEVILSYFKADKLNIGSLGNKVQQLHVHLIGRFIDDPNWPEGLWQPNLLETPYERPQPLVKELSRLLLDALSRPAS